jgi:hypothetical protein
MTSQVPDSSKQERKVPVKSTYLFPAYDLDLALEVAQGIEEGGAGRLSEETLAINMGLSAKSSGFRLKGLTARQFGLVTKRGEVLETTPLAKAILKPRTDQEREAALKESFLQIPLFKVVCGRFKGQPLPPGQAFRNVLEREFHLESARVGPAERVLLESARQAGMLVASGGNTYLSTDSGFASAAPPVVTPRMERSDHGLTSDAAYKGGPPAPPAGRSSGGMLVISEEDLAQFGDSEFQEVWNALGKVFRQRGRRLLAEEARQQSMESNDVPDPGLQDDDSPTE